ncbi:MAG TPA: glycogen/starch synthase, partial [Vicinamibacterales bacterium]
YTSYTTAVRILMLASEVAPFAKTGGLADVTGSLPKALAALGHEVRLVMPAYSPIEAAHGAGKWGLRALDLTLQVPVAGGPVQAGAFETTLPGTDVGVYFIAEIRAGMPEQREEQAGIPIHVMPNGDTASARGAALEALRFAKARATA